MGRIQDLKKKLYAMIAQDPKSHDDVLDNNVHGLGQPTSRADDRVQPMEDELGEEQDMEGGEHPDDDDPLAQMALEFKPKAKTRRPGTAMLIAAATKAPTSKTAHTYGNRGKHKGGF